MVLWVGYMFFQMVRRLSKVSENVSNSSKMSIKVYQLFKCFLEIETLTLMYNT